MAKPKGLRKVWLAGRGGSDDLQHVAESPGDEVTLRWEGTTACGATGELRHITRENVDGGRACPACTGAVGSNPPLEGEDLGPV